MLVELSVNLVNEWGVQILVLFSFSLQVLLLSFAWIRRHSMSTLARMLLWLAYLLADSTALFTLGHLSISSKLQGHRLVAFWAPLLLVHLGGQDTITAYSFEDNRLWLRHLQTLVVQVMGTFYVLYKYIPGSERMVMVAAGLIFVVGILKYGERIWALKCATGDSIWSNLEKSAGENKTVVPVPATAAAPELLLEILKRRHNLDEEDVLMAAHGLLDVCKGLFIGLRCGRRENVRQVLHSFEMYGHLDKLMEMELSLMYDIMYTKAVVIHTWYGCCIRVVAPAATVAALLLFQLSSKDGQYSGHDIVITYVLLVGALLLELASLVRAAGSTWAARAMQLPWRWLHDELLALRRAVRAARHRRWSGFVGQYNLLSACARGSICMEGAAAAPAGVGPVLEWWHRRRNSRSDKVPDSAKEMVLRELLVLRRSVDGQEMMIGSMPGLLTLRRLHLHGLLGWSIQDIGFEDSIIAWHVASDICLFADKPSPGDHRADDDLREAIKLLSDYMMFLLVARPYMLPGPVHRSRYVLVRRDLSRLMLRRPHPPPPPNNIIYYDDSPADRRRQWALGTGLRALITSFDTPASYDTAVILANMLCHQHNRLEVIFGVWVEMLCYVADHCSKESHARQLSGGGELVTIVWLMARHANLSYVSSSST